MWDAGCPLYQSCSTPHSHSISPILSNVPHCINPHAPPSLVTCRTGCGALPSPTQTVPRTCSPQAVPMVTAAASCGTQIMWQSAGSLCLRTWPRGTSSALATEKVRNTKLYNSTVPWLYMQRICIGLWRIELRSVRLYTYKYLNILIYAAVQLCTMEGLSKVLLARCHNSIMFLLYMMEARAASLSPSPPQASSVVAVSVVQEWLACSTDVRPVTQPMPHSLSF